MRELPPGTRIGPYAVVKLLGRGGMGAVYEARDPSLGRSVAVKVMTDGGPQHLERFRRELRVMATLAHPALVAIHAGDAFGQVPYVAMELLPGGSLLDRVRTRGPLGWREAARLGVALAGGLEAIHAAGLVHRDLKPHNVLFDAKDAPKITDFGVARVERVTERLTQTGELLGTPGYMAPEQTDGSSIDGRADLYALGATLYFAVTGRVPFDGGGPMATITKQLRGELPSASSIVRTVPPELDAVLSRLLSVDRDGRPSSARQAGDLLRRLLEAEAPTAPPWPSGGRGLLVGLIGGVALVVLLGAVAVALVGPRPPSPPTPTTPTPTAPPATTTPPPPPATTPPPATPAPRLRRVGARGLRRWILTSQGAGLALAPGDRALAGDDAGFLFRFDPSGVAEASARLAGSALHAIDCRADRTVVGGADGMIRLLDGQLRPLASVRAERAVVRQLLLTEDGARVVSREVLEGGQTRLRLRATAALDAPAQEVGAPGDGATGLALVETEGGVRLAAVSGKAVRLFDLDRPDGPAGTIALPEPAAAIAAVKDGLVVASQPDVGGRVIVRVFDFLTGSARPLEEAVVEEVLALAVSPDGTRLVAGCSIGPRSEVSLRAWDLTTGRIAWPAKAVRTHGPRGAAAGVRVTSDGLAALVVSHDGTLGRYDLATGEDLREFGKHHRAAITCVSAFADGTVFTGSGDWQLGRWAAGDEAPRTTRIPKLFTPFCMARGAAPEESLLVGGESGRAVLLRRVTQANANAVPIESGSLNVARVALARDGSGALLGYARGRVRHESFVPGEGPKAGALDGPPAGLDLLPDGRALLVGSTGQTLLWTVSTDVVDTLRQPGEPLAGGAWLVGPGRALLAQQAARLELWSLAGRERLSPPGHQGPVLALAVSLDERLALTTALDGTVRLWSLPELLPLEPAVDLGPDADLPLCAAFAVDGRRAWVGTARGVLLELAVE